MNNFFTRQQVQIITTKLPARQHEAVYNFYVYLNKIKKTTDFKIHKETKLFRSYRVISASEWVRNRSGNNVKEWVQQMFTKILLIFWWFEYLAYFNLVFSKDLTCASVDAPYCCFIIVKTFILLFILYRNRQTKTISSQPYYSL